MTGSFNNRCFQLTNSGYFHAELAVSCLAVVVTIASTCIYPLKGGQAELALVAGEIPR